MKLTIPFCFLFCIYFQSFSQNNCDFDQFNQDKPIFSYEIDSNQFYIPTDWAGISQTFTIYKSKRSGCPFIMFIHGGGFQKGDKRNLYKRCRMLAQRGFVTASINYRTAEINGTNLNRAAPYLAQQDAHDAWLYFRKHANEFGIDTNNMFVAGESAGAIIALSMAFISPEDWYKKLPGINDQWGSLKTITPPKGVINMWGIISDLNYISKEEAKNTPLLMFHGIDDNICPYDEDGPPNFPEKVYGSKAIAKRYDELGGKYHFYFGDHIGHGEGFNDYYIQLKTLKYLKQTICTKSQKIKQENVANLYWFEFSPRPTLNVNGLGFIDRILLSILCIFLLVCLLRQKGFGQRIVSIMFIFGIWSMWFNIPWELRIFYYWISLAMAFLTIILIKNTISSEKGFVCLMTGILFLRSFSGINSLVFTHWIGFCSLIPLIWGIVYMVRRKNLAAPPLRSFSLYLLVECVVAIKQSITNFL